MSRTQILSDLVCVYIGIMIATLLWEFGSRWGKGNWKTVKRVALDGLVWLAAAYISLCWQ